MKRQDSSFTRAATARICALLCVAALSFLASQSASAAVAETWVQRYGNVGSNATDWASQVVIDPAGDVIMAGYSSDGMGSSRRDMLVIKYSGASGSVLWQKLYNGPAHSYDAVAALAVDADGNVVVTGPSYKTYSIDSDFYTAKYASLDGALLWEKRYDGGNDRPTAMLLDGSGNVVVSGYSYAYTYPNVYTTNGRVWYMAKYASTNGALVWEKHHYGDEPNRSKAMAVDASNNVLVAISDSPNAGYYRAKYAAADGALLWEKRDEGILGHPTPSYFFSGVAVDGSGNLVVAGSINNLTNYDGYTVKYAAADGAVVWEKRFDGSSGTANGSAMAVDSSGNVVVTGRHYNLTAGIERFYTVKYAEADGTVLWDKRYAAGWNAVAVDKNGNVVVSGNTSTSGSGFDYAMAKYASLDGALLWEKRFNGRSNDADFTGTPRSLALGPNGMVAVTGTSRDNILGPFSYATVVYREALPSISLEMIPSGVRLYFTSTPGSTSQIERAPSVSGPWDVIANPVASASGLVEYLDTNRPHGTAFYRTRTP